MQRDTPEFNGKNKMGLVFEAIITSHMNVYAFFDHYKQRELTFLHCMNIRWTRSAENKRKSAMNIRNLHNPIRYTHRCDKHISCVPFI